MQKMTFVVDIDDTILKSEKEKCNKCGRITYKNAVPIKDEIKALNTLYKAGHIVILFTGRNWDCYDITKEQLKKNKILYSELVMGKPSGVFIDADAKTTLKDFI